MPREEELLLFQKGISRLVSRSLVSFVLWLCFGACFLMQFPDVMSQISPVSSVRSLLAGVGAGIGDVAVVDGMESSSTSAS